MAHDTSDTAVITPPVLPGSTKARRALKATHNMTYDGYSNVFKLHVFMCPKGHIVKEIKRIGEEAER